MDKNLQALLLLLSEAIAIEKSKHENLKVRIDYSRVANNESLQNNKA